MRCFFPAKSIEEDFAYVPQHPIVGCVSRLPADAL